MDNLTAMEAQILGLLAREDSPKGVYGLDISRGIGATSSISASLHRLRQAGCIERRWQDDELWPRTGRQAPVEPAAPGVLRRAYYRITPKGRTVRTEQAAPVKAGRGRAKTTRPQTA